MRPRTVFGSRTIETQRLDPPTIAARTIARTIVANVSLPVFCTENSTIRCLIAKVSMTVSVNSEAQHAIVRQTITHLIGDAMCAAIGMPHSGQTPDSLPKSK